MQTKIVAQRKHGEQVICVPSIGERIWMYYHIKKSSLRPQGLVGEVYKAHAQVLEYVDSI